MDNTMPVPEWVQFIGSEYLESFIKEGGAAVKFTVTAEDRIPALRSHLALQSQGLGCAFAPINAVDTRVHMPQDIFYAISRQVDWRLAARRVIIDLALAAKYRVDDIDPSGVAPSANDGIYAAIGAANGLDAAAVLRELRPAIQNRVAMNRNMARDFRVAMTHLCLLEGVGYGSEYGGQPLIDWLTGTNPRISNVRHFAVHTPINRTTARHFMESAFYWLRYAGYGGIVILLDNTRVTLARRPADGSRFYTRPMVIDHYELLRELIDSADRLSGTLVVVAANPDFLDEDTRHRGFGIYEALMTRVMNDVRDKNLVNPMASLVRLS